MGRVRAEDIEALVKEIFISLELDDFQAFREKMDKLLSIDLNQLSEKEAKILYHKLTKIEERISKRQSELAKKIGNSTNIQKYGLY
jgi:predicted metallopeptidase